MAFIVVSKNEWYRLHVDTGKNRVHLKIAGRWEHTSIVPYYKEDWQKALNLTFKNFTVFTDASEMKIGSPEIKALLVETQHMIKEAGVLRAAELVNDELTELQLDAIARRTQFPKENFYLPYKALLWLDEVEDLSTSQQQVIRKTKI